LSNAPLFQDGNSTIGRIQAGNVQLSHKHSLALTDVTLLTPDADDPRLVALHDTAGPALCFLANSAREAELILGGVQLLLEQETLRLGVRGGLPCTALGSQIEGAMSPSAARGFREPRKRQKKTKNVDISCDSSSMDPRDVSTATSRSLTRPDAPRYRHGRPIHRDIARNIVLPMAFTVCRVLLLDSSSPVHKHWNREKELKGDADLEVSPWSFPPDNPREAERGKTENDLIANGYMTGASRSMIFSRPRYGNQVPMAEVNLVESDDIQRTTYTISEKSPHRGFATKIRVVVHAIHENTCEANVFCELTPVGKDVSNQEAVHKAFLMVQQEVRERYGLYAPAGMMSCFCQVVDEMAAAMGNPVVQRRGDMEEKKMEDLSPQRPKSGLVSFDDILKTGRESPDVVPTVHRPSTPSLQRQIPEADPSKRIQHARESTTVESPSLMTASVPTSDTTLQQLAPIEVKPLPKIRLSLMPSPREEDELKDSEEDSPRRRKKKKKKAKRHTSKTRQQSEF